MTTVLHTTWSPSPYLRPYLVGPEGLLQVSVLQEACHRQHIRSRVHHDKEEDPSQIESGQGRVVLHHVVQQGRDLLYQDRVKGQQ